MLISDQPYWSECSTMYDAGKFKRAQKQPLSGHLRLYTYKALKQLLELHGFKVIDSKEVTYNNLPKVFKHLDRLISKILSLAQVIMV